MLLMLKGLKVVFAAFTQHCIQSSVTHVTHVEGVENVLCIKWPLAPPGGKTCTAFHLLGLAVHHQSV